MSYNTRKGSIYLQHDHQGVPDYVLKYNIPKQKEINQCHVHPLNELRHTSNVKKKPFCGIPVKALTVFAAFSGVSVQGLQPRSILLCKTGLDRVVKQP